MRTLFVGNLPKRGWVDGPYDGPSWTQSYHTYAITSATLFITLDGKYDGLS